MQPKRTFTTGATRNNDEDALDFEGFNSPLVGLRFARFMHKNRFLEDGTMRASDNWQAGIPLDSYMKSLERHMTDVALHHDGYPDLARDGLQEALCAVLFNAQGYLFELLKAERQKT